MESKTYLSHYRVPVNHNGTPIEVRREGIETVYKAEDTKAGREVALTLIPSAGLRPNVLSELKAEAAAAQKISHINIPQLFDFGFEDEQLVYASEYFEGSSAAEWVTTHGPMPIGAVLRIGLQVVSALGAAIFHGIVHRSINPRNVILVPGQTPEGDWPLVKVLNFYGSVPASTAPAVGSALRLEEFASPEQIEDGTVDFSSAVYSLGCTMTFLLTGAASGAELAIKNASGIPKVVKRLIGQMVAREPIQRPKDSLALEEEIRECLAQVERRASLGRKFGIPVNTAAVPVVEPRPRRQWPMKPLALAATILAAAALAVLILPATGVFQAKNDAIGVPVGVPEKQVAPASTTVLPNALASTNVPRNEVASAPQAEPQPEPVTNQVAANPVVPAPAAPSPTAAPRVLASAPEPDPIEEAPAFASNTVPAPVESVEPARSIEPAASEPAPPAEGPEPVAVMPDLPRDETSVPQMPAMTEAPAPVVSDAPVDAPATDAPAVVAAASEPRVEEPRVTRSRQTKPAEKPAKIAKASKPAQSSKKVNVANSGQLRRALGRGPVRAQYLGTTREGELIFGLPSSERVYAAPPPDLSAEGVERLGRVRRALPPVLPALPPDPDPSEDNDD